MPRHRALDLVQIRDAAFALAAEEGERAVTMRAVAARTYLSPMSLYTYVKDAEGLRALMVDGLIPEAAELNRVALADTEAASRRRVAEAVRRAVIENAASGWPISREDMSRTVRALVTHPM